MFADSLDGYLQDAKTVQSLALDLMYVTRARNERGAVSS